MNISVINLPAWRERELRALAPIVRTTGSCKVDRHTHTFSQSQDISMTIVTTTPHRHKVNKNQIRFALITILSGLFWGWVGCHRADAAIPFSTAFAAMGVALSAFVTTIGATPLIPVLVGLMVVIPWILLILVSSIIVWQVYEGYKEYERENLSGMVKPALNICVILLLTFLADRAVTFVVTGA